jgi:hypothetical protein
VVSDGVTTIEPEVPFGVKLVPLQSVAFVLLHVSVDDSPVFIDLLEAERVAVGVGGNVTVTIERASGDTPPAPAQVIE